MPDRVFTDCPHCGKRNDYSRAELDQAQSIAKSVFRGSPSLHLQEPQEYIVTCKHCGQSFKIFVSM